MDGYGYGYEVLRCHFTKVGPQPSTAKVPAWRILDVTAVLGSRTAGCPLVARDADRGAGQ
jgi:hypothetical protein